ncbi:hypothetical protein IWX85_002732 [Polaromonas sp. CG_9.11]|nr:hypothetical protein [Polaromonas sp. CG_9.11]
MSRAASLMRANCEPGLFSRRSANAVEAIPAAVILH